MIRLTAIIAVITIINSVHGFSIDLQKGNVRQGRVVGAGCDDNDGCDADNNEVCSNGQCVCDMNFFPNGEFPVVCVPGLGGACEEDANCMVDAGQGCDMDNEPNVCVCDADRRFYEEPADAGVCVRGFGAGCDPAAANNECGFPNMICNPATTTCSCAENFRRDGAAQGPMRCVPSVGATCDGADITCDLDNQECGAPNNDGGRTCQCVQNFGLDETSGNCVPASGAACGVGVADPFTQGDDGCNLGSVCLTAAGAASANGDNADDVCGCDADSNMVPDPNRPGFCIPTEGGTCTAAISCDLPNQGCFAANMMPAANDGTDTCQCNAGAEAQETADNAALNECVLSLGSACDENDACISGSACNAGECQCVAPRIDSNGADPLGSCDAGHGESCANGVDCVEMIAGAASGLICNADEVCACNPALNVAANDDGECVNTIGGGCEANGNDDCPLINQQCQGADGSEAAEGGAGSVCGCATPFVDDGNGQCARGAGAACDADNPCGANMNLLCDDSDAAAPVCAPGVDGSCAADANCPFANQQCEDAGGNVVAEATAGATCQCALGSEAGDNPLLCDAWTSGACEANGGNCGIDQGDCNGDDGCDQTGDPLACGTNNCPADQGRPLADCCYDPAAVTPATDCLGGGPLTWSCCTPANPCGENQGDCDDDPDCAGDLVCGANMCNADFNTAFDGAGFFPAGSADCCVTQATVDAAALFYKTHDESGYDMRREYWQNYDEPQRQLPKY